MIHSCGPLHMAEQRQNDQLEPTYNSYVRIRDAALETCQKQWTIERSGERVSEISILISRLDDNDDDDEGETSIYFLVFMLLCWLRFEHYFIYQEIVYADLVTTHTHTHTHIYIYACMCVVRIISE